MTTRSASNRPVLWGKPPTGALLSSATAIGSGPCRSGVRSSCNAPRDFPCRGGFRQCCCNKQPPLILSRKCVCVLHRGPHSQPCFLSLRFPFVVVVAAPLPRPRTRTRSPSFRGSSASQLHLSRQRPSAADTHRTDGFCHRCSSLQSVRRISGPEPDPHRRRCRLVKSDI